MTDKLQTREMILLELERKPDIDAILTQASHAPRPWRSMGRDILDRDGSIVATCPSKGEAALIVAAVNAYEPMREALKIMVERLGHYAGEESRTALARIRELVPDLVTK